MTSNRVHDAEPNRALEDPDPLHSSAQRTGRRATAFMLDPNGITHIKPSAPNAWRKLAHAPPGGRNPLRAAVGECLRHTLSPRLATLHHDAFAFDEPVQSSVEVAAQPRGARPHRPSI